MNVRHILHKGMLALLAALTMSSCDMMTEDLSDCPTGLYVSFVYDYNIQRADMLKDHVGGLTLYVYDESDRLVATRTMSGSQLSRYGSYLHFTEEELAPDHSYRLMAVARQTDMPSATGAKYIATGTDAGSSWQQFFVELDHYASATHPGYYDVSSAAPLDTLWHTLTTLTSPADAFPKVASPDQLTPAATDYSWQRDGSVSTNGQEKVSIVRGEPTYATVSLIRDTKHLNITLRALNYDQAKGDYVFDSNQVLDRDYTVEIVDNNAQLDCQNNLSKPADTLVYRPYCQWTTTFVGNGQVASESAAHYDLMFNRLVYKNASVEDDRYAVLSQADIATSRNAVLVIRKRDTGEIVFGINLPYILASGRTYQERYYHYQEYLDREYDYRLQFILRGGRMDEIQLLIGTHIHIIPWAKRYQGEVIE